MSHVFGNNKIIANLKSQFDMQKFYLTKIIAKSWSRELNKSNMHLNKNPSPHIDLFRLFGTNTNELQNLKCSSYPVHLNVKHTYANEYEEATDGLKSRKLKCLRCQKNCLDVWELQQ